MADVDPFQQPQMTIDGSRDFDEVPSDAMRLYYSRETERVDPDGDQRLSELHLAANALSAPFDIDEYAELVNRPYYLCKLAPYDEGDETLQLIYKRPVTQFDADRDRAVPFDPAEDRRPIVLFREPQLVPLVAGRIVAFRQKTPRSATGLLELERVELAQ